MKWIKIPFQNKFINSNNSQKLLNFQQYLVVTIVEITQHNIRLIELLIASTKDNP